ncbi:hypothetical protein QO034_20570 [Sedimentitalea sp. JM2-8]|uniref:Uncharacterized protein n=1 Tax=Sedimentitalea xiamensis TaxID=3050037 RepID=A0ABT7FK02_9RHOB|nr:hypothetical protein [Sedimentitalea xiamensis]MDK3075473.1 hypothetical protein [Sedimentitalea xiamensis]
MRRHLSGAIALAILLVGAPGAGDAFTSRSGARVNPVNQAVFEVVPRSSGNGPIIWCAAADYAQRALKAPWQARVYVARGRGVSVTTGRRSAVQFTLDPAAAGIVPNGTSLSLNSFAVGDSMSVQQAFGYCQKQMAF